MPFGRAIPSLPVHDIDVAVSTYVDRFGFDLVHADTGLAVLQRDGVELHLLTFCTREPAG